MLSIATVASLLMSDRQGTLAPPTPEEEREGGGDLGWVRRVRA